MTQSDKYLMEILSRLQQDVDEANEKINDLEKWKDQCNRFVAGAGAIWLFVLTLAGIIANYYHDIKATLLGWWIK